VRYILAILTISMGLNLFAQGEGSSMTDDRDGEIYTTVTIDGIEWFRDNLRYQTETSFCPNDSKALSDCAQGNFYTNAALDSVCPAGWRIPNDKDWKQYFAYRLQSKEGSLLDVRLDTMHEEYLSVIYRDTTSKVSLLDESNPLGIDEVGWVQGKKRQAWGTTTFWIRNTEVEDKRFHLHVRNQNFTIHRHSHHVEDRKRMNRRFMVKCVRSLTDAPKKS